MTHPQFPIVSKPTHTELSAMAVGKLFAVIVLFSLCTTVLLYHMAAGDQHHLVAARRHFSRRIGWFGPEPVIRPECSLPPPPPAVPSSASSPPPSRGAAPSPPAVPSSASSPSPSHCAAPSPPPAVPSSASSPSPSHGAAPPPPAARSSASSPSPSHGAAPPPASSPSPSHGAAPSPPAARSSATSLSPSNGAGSLSPAAPSSATSLSPSNGGGSLSPAAPSSATSLSPSHGAGSPSPAARECVCICPTAVCVCPVPSHENGGTNPFKWCLTALIVYMVATGIYGCMNPEGLKEWEDWLANPSEKYRKSDRWFVVVLRHYVKAIYYVALGALIWMLAKYFAYPVIEFVSTGEIRERPELEWVHTLVLTFGDIIHRH